MDNLALKSQMDTKELLLLDSEVKKQGKDMVVGYLLWWFLGYFGGHRFYMGKTGTAVTMLILSITIVGLLVTTIWWIVDGFLLHKYIKEHNSEVENKMILNITQSRVASQS